MTFSLVYDADAAPQAEDWVVVVNQGKLLSLDGALLHQLAATTHLNLSSDSFVFLGRWSGRPCFAVAIQESAAVATEDFSSLRQFLGVVDDPLFSLAARATQLIHWWEHHKYCGRCGAPTQLHRRELMLSCSSCSAGFYPTISPCVIGIVSRGKQCLLAHNVRFKEGVYSALAGFIEPGESAEQAFVREVYEEVGLTINNIRYVESQAWPFPSQLMLGFTAEYAAGDIQVDNVEIQHADWFAADQLPIIPPPGTLSGKLIRGFFDNLKRY